MDPNALVDLPEELEETTEFEDLNPLPLASAFLVISLLQWATMSVAGTEGLVIFCLHGGGSSGLSFILARGKIKQKILYRHNPLAIVLVGHNMGGAIVVHLAAERVFSTLTGLIVVDVVEGTTMASLIHIQEILASRPCHFPSVKKAIKWSVKGGSLRNCNFSRVLVPSTLQFDNEKQYCYVWHTHLEKTEEHWKVWYEGLSDTFLPCPVAKLLLGLLALNACYVTTSLIVSRNNITTIPRDFRSPSVAPLSSKIKLEPAPLHGLTIQTILEIITMINWYHHNRFKSLKIQLFGRAIKPPRPPHNRVPPIRP